MRDPFDRPSPLLTPLVARALAGLTLAIGIAAFVRPFFLSDWYGNDEVDRYPGRLDLLHAHATWTDPLPRWIPELAGGHGYPLFNFFNAGSMFVALPFRAAGLDPFTATKLALVVMLVLGVSHAAALGRRLWGPGAGVVAGALLLVAPYTVANFYHRGDFAEGWANLLFPVVLYHDLALREGALHDRPRLGSFVALALAWAALVPAHAFSALLFALAFAAFFVARALSFRRRHGHFCRGDVWVFAASTLGVALAAIYWLPALGEKHTVRIDEFFSLDKLMASALSPGDLLDPTPEGRIAAPRRLTLGAVVPLLALASLVVVRRRRELPRRALTFGLAFACAFALFMTTRAAEPVYATVPLVGQILFPYRFLGLATFFGTLVAARAVPLLVGRARRELVGLALAAIVIALAQPHLQLTNPVDFPEGHADFAARAANETILFDYGEYYPKRVVDVPLRAREPQTASRGCTLLEARFEELTYSLQVRAAQACTITLAQFRWLGWEATLDDAPLELANDANGRMVVHVPTGEHRVVVGWKPTTLQRTARAISAVSLVVLVVLLGLALVRTRPARALARLRSRLRSHDRIPAALRAEADALDAQIAWGDEEPAVLEERARSLSDRARAIVSNGVASADRRTRHVATAVAAACVVALAGSMLWPRPRVVARASTFLGGDPTFGAERAIDGLETTQWLEHEPRGYLEVSLVPPRAITEVELLNASTLDGSPRSTERFRLEVLDEESVRHEVEGTLAPGERRTLSLATPRVTTIRFEVRSHRGPGGGLTELVVR